MKAEKVLANALLSRQVASPAESTWTYFLSNLKQLNFAALAFGVADKLHVDAAVVKRGNAHCFDLDGIDAGPCSKQVRETRLARSTEYLADKDKLYWDDSIAALRIALRNCTLLYRVEREDS